MTTDKQVFDAIDVFTKELQSWAVVPDKSSEYNDKGYLKYKYSWVHDVGREEPVDYSSQPVGDRVFERHHLETEIAKNYPMFRAMKAVLEQAK